MKITIKTLQQHSFIVEISSTETVSVLKKRIENMKGKDVFPVAGQKLIYAGKMLDDTKKIQDYEIDENNFVVVMVSKMKSTPPLQQPPSPSADVSNAGPDPSNKQEKSSLPKSSSVEMPVSASDTSETALPDTSNVGAASLLAGARYEENIKNIVAMGFAEDEVKFALRASFNNPDRAVEYLTNGIPENLKPAMQNFEGEQPVETEGRERPAEINAFDSSNENPFEFLRNQPQFQQMCRALRENPSFLPSFMQELRDSNPQLLAQISRNQAAFIDLINSTSDSTERPADKCATTLREPEGIPSPAGNQYIQISAEDKAAVDRLKDLGFSEAYVVQVYMACERNETLAANLLLEDPDKD